MENSVKALIMGATVLIVLVIIGIGVMILNTSKDMAQTANSEIADVSQELSQMKYDAYNDTVVSGSTVLNALRKFSDNDNFGIQVCTGRNTAGTWYYGTANSTGVVTDIVYGTGVDPLEMTRDESDVEYVNPSGKFNASLVYNDSNVVKAVIFIQQ